MGKKGFTLVEVLVAIIIIMILATYSVLKYTETIYEGKNKTAKAQMEVVAGAYKRYLMEYPERPLNGVVGFDSSTSLCVADSVSFPCGKPNLAGIDYTITLGTPSNTPSCNNSLATMTAKAGAKVGDKSSESGYCAYIDRYGRATDVSNS